MLLPSGFRLKAIILFSKCKTWNENVKCIKGRVSHSIPSNTSTKCNYSTKCLLTWLRWCPGAPGWRAQGWWCSGGCWSPPCQCSESPGTWWASLSWSGVSIVHWGLWRHHAMHLEDCLTLILMQLATNCVQFYSQSSLIVVTVRGPPLAASDAPLTSERVTWSEDRRPLSRQIHISRLFLYTWPVYLLYK